MTTSILSSCPFWSPTTSNCKISLDGLFIPLDDHIDTYCKSADYCQCDQNRGKNCTDEVDLYHTVSERRQCDRHSGSHKITITQAGEYLEGINRRLTARIVDFSEGGLRLLAAKQLDRDTTVTCFFDENMPDYLRSGEAMIRWCRPLLNSNGYQAGLSFKDERFTLAMNSLGILT